MTAPLARSRRVGPALPSTKFDIEPETSMTKIRLAFFRSFAHSLTMSVSTDARGGRSTLSFWSGSMPFSAVTAPPGAPSKLRNAASWNRFCCSGSCT